MLFTPIMTTPTKPSPPKSSPAAPRPVAEPTVEPARSRKKTERMEPLPADAPDPNPGLDGFK